jgi:hypothetical protein
VSDRATAIRMVGPDGELSQPELSTDLVTGMQGTGGAGMELSIVARL